MFAVTKDKFYNDLDLHADTVEGDVKLPLVVYGDEGNDSPPMTVVQV